MLMISAADKHSGHAVMSRCSFSSCVCAQPPGTWLSMTPEGGALIQASCCTSSSSNFQQVFRSGGESDPSFTSHITCVYSTKKKTD